jgi:hypothetical protein
MPSRLVMDALLAGRIRFCVWWCGIRYAQVRSCWGFAGSAVEWCRIYARKASELLAAIYAESCSSGSIRSIECAWCTSIVKML